MRAPCGPRLGPGLPCSVVTVDVAPGPDLDGALQPGSGCPQARAEAAGRTRAKDSHASGSGHPQEPLFNHQMTQKRSNFVKAVYTGAPGHVSNHAPSLTRLGQDDRSVSSWVVLLPLQLGL